MKKILYIFVFIFIASCTSNTIYKKPDDLIPKDKMVSLLTDLYLANGTSNIKNINLDRKVDYTPLIFDKYLIDSTRFNSSNLYYTSRVDDYDEILEYVSINLKTLKKVTDSIRREKDSLENSNFFKPKNSNNIKYKKQQIINSQKEGDFLKKEIDTGAYIK